MTGTLLAILAGVMIGAPLGFVLRSLMWCAVGEGWDVDLRGQGARDGETDGLGGCSQAGAVHGGAYDR